MWCGGTLGAGAADEPIDPIVGIRTTQVAPLTGSSSVNRTEGVDVIGTDLGVLAEVDGTIYIAFGDTFGYGKTNWRSNVLARTTDVEPSDGITLDGWITDELGRAREIVPGLKESNDAGGEVTKIPTALTSVDGRLYMAFMSVRRWGPPGRWDANYATWAYSDDRGEAWHVVDPPIWPEESGFIMLAVSQQRGRGNAEGYLWLLATPAGRFGGVKAARVRPEEILDRGAYQYYSGPGADGQPQWSRDPAEAVEVIPAPAGEGSLLWNPYLDRWIYTYLNERSHNMELRSAPRPWGPWSRPHTLSEAAKYPSLYGGFMTPSWVEDDGRVIYFLMSQFGPYNVYVMRAELETGGGPTDE
ncbi:carbohydrate-binding protein [Limnochorda pilosa]|uniref:Carbohydrate-binding protein n=1 Tax=Limnochorda pilosa TaxID=1555112 RepID=A0A0K2SL96_LIMPI|nr:carbohydrate-binding protein [Limnochorda pilosa]